MVNRAQNTLILVTVVSSGVIAQWSHAAEMLYPARDGTLADGGVFGPFDGVPDAWDWVFNGTTFEGAITLVTGPPQSGLEHRVFWEYSLSRISATEPLTARLTFMLRGSTIFGSPDTEVSVFSYPSDLLENAADFSAGPAQLIGTVTVAALAPPAAFTFDVSRTVNDVLYSGGASVAFRFQINPNTSNTLSQAFIDADERDVTTKPRLTITDVTPGDLNGDRILDRTDFALFPDCVSGPGTPFDDGCDVYDLDLDDDVDHRDLAEWLRLASSTR